MHKLTLIPILALFLSVSILPAIGREPVHMAKQAGAPVTEAGIPIFSCAMELIQQNYRFHEVPWKRAQMGTETGEYDGFLMAQKTKKRDQYAFASAPFVFTDWVYIVHSSMETTPYNNAFHDLRIGANVGTARHAWLSKMEKKGKLTKKIVSASDTENAWRMLVNQRMDVLLDNRADLDHFRSTYDPENLFQIYTARQVELSAYFSKTFINKNPTFLPAFNQAITDCLARQ